jgi:MFS family permease
MNPAARAVQRTYLTLLLFSTLSASLIWGINTLFLLDAGLSNLEAFAANAFFTAGLVLFEVPAGVIADFKGRRVSYLTGTTILIISTLLYLMMWQVHAPFWAWAISSAFLGFGFTFFTGAVEAWLVDALNFSGYKGKHDTVFAKGQVVQGVAMLSGSVLGGVIAQFSNLGAPYIVRIVLLAITLALAFALMRDLGFKPIKSTRVAKEIKTILQESVRFGLRIRPVRWIMLSGIFVAGVSIYAFYALQPYLLELYGNPHAYSIAGLAAAILAGAQIAGGFFVPYIEQVFHKRTSIIVSGIIVSVLALAAFGFIQNFWLAIFVIIIWGFVFAAIMPVRQGYLNEIIPSKQRATILSFDSLLGSSGGVVIQPILGKVADVWNYPASYLASAAIQALAIPFAWLAHREKSPADKITDS